ncbi:MAG TPA: universal stress protein [Hyphomicrobiaceae bacterium]|jgi:nucleotide-binding universal stress UspA family protein|nr:universal stress protein [Hyphomicrobiaceae bacterium]
MFTNILLAVDGSPPSLHAARHGIELAKALSAKVTALTVTTPWATYFSRELAVLAPGVVIPETEYDNKRDTIAAGILQDVMDEADAAGVRVAVLHRCSRYPYQAILETAKREGCDLIIMGSRRERGFTGSLVGSETLKVITHTNIPVLVWRETTRSAALLAC